MSDKINVLIFPCGAENALEIYSALSTTVNVEVLGGSSRSDHGELIYRQYTEELPYINHPDFIRTLNRIIAEYSINIIFPTHDDIMLFLSEKAHLVRAKIATPGLMQATICRSKMRTYSLFKDCSFCPAVYSKLDDISAYPAFAKPDRGQGGKGATQVNSRSEAEIYLSNKNFVVTEFLPGDELTVDCFTDRRGQLLFCGPRTRERVFGGISVRSSRIHLSIEIEEIAVEINRRLKMRGLWYFQLKMNSESRLKLLEISARAAGSMNVYRALGVNFPLLTVYDLMDMDVSIQFNDIDITVDRALFNRYKSNIEFDTIYIDFDDTITLRGSANPFVLMFLYRMKDLGKKIIVLSRHKHDIHNTLQSLRIHPDIFDDICILEDDEEKSAFIVKDVKSVFIDNAYKERRIVKETIGIPVFDVDAITVLMDWKF